jgi:hypothetical protein
MFSPVALKREPTMWDLWLYNATYVKPNSVTLGDKGNDNNEATQSVLPFESNVQNSEELSIIHCEKDSALTKKQISVEKPCRYHHAQHMFCFLNSNI